MLEKLRQEGKHIPDKWAAGGQAVFDWWVWGDHGGRRNLFGNNEAFVEERELEDRRAGVEERK
jgi:hypothetical protein